MPEETPITALGWGRALLRGTILSAVVFGGLALMLLLRVAERPLFGMRRPITPWITVAVCRSAFPILGMGFTTRGTPMRARGIAVSNHASWLDIFSLNARQRIYFVSKSEVRSWPAVGWLARATGTVFIDRDPRQAVKQSALFRERLASGHRLLFFPEGTSTDGRRVLPFAPTLFEALFADPLRQSLWVQPITVLYSAPAGADERFYGWWGGMEFAPHLLKVLAAPRQGRVEVVYHPPLKVADFADRKALAGAAEAVVRRAIVPGISASG